MHENKPCRVAENIGHLLADALCPWCGDDYDRDRHPKAPPWSCPWCQKRAAMLRRVGMLSQAAGAFRKE